ncbi:hypothetical protein SERLA73DRAFT_102238 [Serpula lacrymans var. lacrymans S7.3]|uniref:Cytochrome P450 n=2 Tax=Serpula lacrymans var. lacrymans TaxID=341189 RepID=F8PKU6_SERL3|nr:hypothetical protein SERLA73DRAFT_102238 [Serpula lacrymans var. lacrymans S7.3]
MLSILVWYTFAFSALFYAILHSRLFKLFSVPSHLRHLPHVPALPLLWSYIRREPEDVRMKRFLLPLVNESSESSEGIALMWAFGGWVVHILDPQLYAQVKGLTTKHFSTKDLPIFRFTGLSNIVTTNGEEWKKHSRVIIEAFTSPIPVDLFVSLAKALYEVIDQAPTINTEDHHVNWSDLAQRFSLDAVSYSILGFDFDAIRTESQFVKEFNAYMDEAAVVLYIIFPSIEKILPRKFSSSLLNSLNDRMQDMIQVKKSDPGEDIMSYLLKSPDMSEKDLRDNMSMLIFAGHETTAGALSTLVYHLADNQDIQKAAREEVLRVLGPSADPSLPLMGPKSLPYVNACVKESLRINPPASYTIPRISPESISLGKYHIPPNTPITPNLYAMHHNETVWSDPHVFRPERFLEDESSELKNAWIPFSSGPRQCPAKNFVMYEVRTLAAMLLREYEWKFPEDSVHRGGVKNGFSTFALTIPYKLDIIFSKRGQE